MYTPLDEAKEEIWKRWNDTDLRQRVLEYVSILPDGYGSEPCAVLSRYIATPNFEAYRFQEIAKHTEIELIFDAFPMDKFCSKNPMKYHLGKMKFYSGKGKNNGNKTSNISLITFHEVDGKPLCTLNTPWSENFATFHERLFNGCFPTIKVVDNSEWTQASGDTISEYYCRFLSIFICHGILFENFLLDKNEISFTQKIVQPAFRKINEFFGLKPLIVQLAPKESESDPYWCWYPCHLEEEVRKKMNGNDKGLGIS